MSRAPMSSSLAGPSGLAQREQRRGGRGAAAPAASMAGYGACASADDNSEFDVNAVLEQSLDEYAMEGVDGGL